jgi:hypothetical protein
MRTELVSQWIAKAEGAAGLPKLEGSLCHACRRKWRTERNHLPISSVAVGGGWTDIATMIRCYDIPDDDAVLEATSNPRRRWEKGPRADGTSECVVAVAS